jgi:hypothetical protein
VDRFQLSLGRDLELSPPQKGQPVNYFIYPYVEVAGQPYSNIVNAFLFRDVSAGEKITRASR